jgi:hypothetical protein
VRAQQVRAGRHVAIYWDGGIRLEVGLEVYGPFAEEGEVVRSATPAGRQRHQQVPPVNNAVFWPLRQSLRDRWGLFFQAPGLLMRVH